MLSAALSYILAHPYASLGWALYALSDAMPFLPGKAQGLAQLLLNVGKAILTRKGPPIAALLPLLFILGTVPSCGVVGPVIKQCELGQLPAAEQAIVAAVGEILLNTASTIADLEALAMKIGPGQVACVVQAWQAYFGTSKPAAGEPGAAMLAAAATTQRAHAQALIAQFLQQHPSSACSRAHAYLTVPPADGALALPNVGALVLRSGRPVGTGL